MSVGIFISWSGDISHKVALALRDWLPSVIQCVEPYVSSEDIEKGVRWSGDIASHLEETSLGIVCLTQENIQAPWLNFEAGALSKKVGESHLWSFLFHLKPSDIQGPISSFQHTKSEDKDDVCKLLQSINSKCEFPISEDRLNTAFEVWWPKLEEKLNFIPPLSRKKEEKSSGRSKGVTKDEVSLKILEELLEISRANYSYLRKNKENSLDSREYNNSKQLNMVTNDLVTALSELEVAINNLKLDSFQLFIDEGSENKEELLLFRKKIMEVYNKFRKPIMFLARKNININIVSPKDDPDPCPW